jgi:hypothetical protein
MTAAFQFIAGVITVVDGDDGRATDVVVTVVTAVAAVGALYSARPFSNPTRRRSAQSKTHEIRTWHFLRSS